MQVSPPVMHASLALIYPKLPLYRKSGPAKSATGLSYMTSTLIDGRLIQIADSPYKSTLCREGVSSCLSFHLNLQLTGTTGPLSWICICVTDEKMQMQMRIEYHWTCPSVATTIVTRRVVSHNTPCVVEMFANLSLQVNET